jgi:hypothetical protein
VTVAVPALAQPAAYSARPLAARVVDDESGAPLAGVIVVAQWKLVREVVPGAMQKAYGDTMRIEETETDADGRFAFAGWGPVPRPAGFHLEHQDPQLLLFKAGHYPRRVENEPRAKPVQSAERASQWDGATIRLRRFTGKPQAFVAQNGRFRDEVQVDGTLVDLAFRVGGLQTELGWSRGTDDWKRYPRMAVALANERERLTAAGLEKKSLFLIAPLASLHGGEGSVRKYLEGVGK